MAFRNVDEFNGLRVVRFEGELPADPTTMMPRVSVLEAGGDLVALIRRLLAQPGSRQLRGLSIGAWAEPAEQGPRPVLAELFDIADHLPSLTTMVFGDLGFEQCEVSWINNDELGPMLNRFPQLEAVLVRGGKGLGLADLDLPQLHTLVVQTGGLDAGVVQQLLDARLPALRHLELYLGAEDHGATTTLPDVAPIISGHAFPGLRYLGIKNSEFQDEIAIAVSQSPLLPRLEVLDLSLGILTDAGARALIAAPALRQLRELNLSHHWLTDEMIARVQGLGIQVDVSDRMGRADEDYRCVAIGE
ncbi:MAG: STM4015 family protein [Propionibacteriaceae bacterium]|nr:STM4015 family protein [Propionibacteriaceae bacterium]